MDNKTKKELGIKSICVDSIIYYILFQHNLKFEFKIDDVYVTQTCFDKKFRQQIFPQHIPGDLISDMCWHLFKQSGEFDDFFNDNNTHFIDGTKYQCIKTKLSDDELEEYSNILVTKGD